MKTPNCVADIKVGSKTIEDIKKWLACWAVTYTDECSGECETCEYDVGEKESVGMGGKTLAYIRQLEECEKSLYAALHAVMYIVDKWLDVEPYDFDKDDGTVAITRASEAREVALRAIEKLEASLAQAERERDAAVHDLTNSSPCFACYHFIRNKGACKGGMRCCDGQFKAEIGHSEYDGPDWRWRGVCSENAKEGTDA